MTLVIETPLGREAERRYVLGVVLSDWLGLAWRLHQTDRRDVRIFRADDPDGPEVRLPDVLLSIGADEWLGPSSLPVPPLPEFAVQQPGSTVLRRGERLPVLYGAAAADADFDVPVDVFGSAFFMLTRYEEAVNPERDRYRRVPAAASLAGRAGFLATPVVDAYVELLWSVLERAWPRLRRTPSGYRVLVTHDVDDPRSTWGRKPLHVVRQFGADLLLRRAPGLAARRARALLPLGAHRGADPNDTFDFLMDVSERFGLRSAFYLQAHRSPDPRAGALYALKHPWIRGLIGRVYERGHEVGYHAGFGTHLDPGRTASEFALLREVAHRQGVRQERWGGRQHYLQWEVPTTWRNWSAAGLDYDCTVAYADAVGFRTGTSREFTVFDLADRRPLALRERPFQVMDATLFGYMGLSPVAALDAVQRLAEQCRRFGGTLGLLWHNDSQLRTSREKRWYARMIESVAPGG